MAGVYIHIPFCRSICHYCDFYKTASLTQVDSYIDALMNETELRGGYLRGEPVETLYFGGGTPSLLKAEIIDRVITKLNRVFHLSGDCEITLEANPDDLTEDYLKSLRDLTSVNRLSIGIQSLNDLELILMNRRHTALQGMDCIDRAKRVGFSNISADLIYGIPGSSPADLKFSMNGLLSLEIKHLSAYHLTIEPKTLFHKKLEKGLIVPVSEEESLAQFSYLIEESGKKGFIHYEISNWALEGYYSKHNTNYWRNLPYLGLGSAAHSYDGTSRQWNVSSVMRYIEGILAGKPLFEMEILSPVNRLNEYLLTSLRTMWGADLKHIARHFGETAAEKIRRSGEKYIQSGHLRQDMDSMTLTREGYFISDVLISDLMEEAPPKRLS